MTSRLFLILFCLTASACAISQKKENRAALYLQMGDDYLAHHDYPEALKAYQAADQLAPNNPKILNSLSMLYFYREKYKVSLDNLTRALKIAPQYTDARNNYARVLIGMGQYDTGIFEIKKVLKDLTYDQQEKAYTNLGLAYMRKNNFLTAKKYLIKALTINKNYCPAYSLYGKTLLKLNEAQSADNIFNKALMSCEDGLEELNYFSALANYQIGNKKLAKRRLQEIINISPASEYAEKAQKLMAALEQVGQ